MFYLNYINSIGVEYADADNKVVKAFINYVIYGDKSDMMSCLECDCFIPDPEQKEYYIEQIRMWKTRLRNSRQYL